MIQTSTLSDFPIRRQYIEEIHAQPRKNFPRRKVVIKDRNDLYQADLIDYSRLKNKNKNYAYALVVINCFTKFIFVRKIKKKSAEDVLNAFKDIVETNKLKFKHLHVDQVGYFIFIIEEINHFSLS